MIRNVILSLLRTSCGCSAYKQKTRYVTKYAVEMTEYKLVVMGGVGKSGI